MLRLKLKTKKIQGQPSKVLPQKNLKGKMGAEKPLKKKERKKKKLQNGS